MLASVGRLRMQIALLVAGAAAVALVVVYVVVVPSLARNLEGARVDRLEHEVLTNGLVGAWLDRTDLGYQKTVVPRTLQTLTNARVFIWQANGPLGGFDDDGGTGRFPNAPDLVKRLARSGTSTVDSEVGTFMGKRQALVGVNYYAGPATRHFVALFAAPLDDARDARNLLARRLLFAGSIALLLAVGLGFAVADALARRLRRLQASADRIAAGDFDHPVVDSSPDEIGDLSRSFEAMRAQLERLDRVRSQFIANASHELRTPLTSLGGFLELVTEDDLDPATRKEFLGTMREQIDRLTKLASDLLDLTRLDADGVVIREEEVDITQVAGDCVREVSALAARSHSEVRLVAEEGQVLAVADETRVRQVLRALIDNALRHTPDGTTVTVAAGYVAGAPTLRVSDDGPGIPAESVQRVFDRFWRGRGAAPQGSGLGLAIARELADRMGGSLDVRSRPGETVFSLTLVAAARPAPVPA